MRKAVNDEADKLITDYGERAYELAREAMREARRHRNGRLENHFAKVAVEIAKRTGREIGVDTATRYLQKGPY